MSAKYAIKNMMPEIAHETGTLNESVPSITPIPFAAASPYISPKIPKIIAVVIEKNG